MRDMMARLIVVVVLFGLGLGFGAFVTVVHLSQPVMP